MSRWLRKLATAEGSADPGREAIHAGGAADAAAGSFSRTEAAGELCEFLYCKWLVLVPTFHDPNDRVALNILAEVFPEREWWGLTRWIWCGAGDAALHDAANSRLVWNDHRPGSDAGGAGRGAAGGWAGAKCRLAPWWCARARLWRGGQNRVLRDLDPTAHAEIVALRAAAEACGELSAHGLHALW